MHRSSVSNSSHQNEGFASPKRKREIDPDDVDMTDASRSPLRLRVELPTRPSTGSTGRSSPHTAMSNQMQDLDIRKEHFPPPPPVNIGGSTLADDNAPSKPQLPPLQLPEPSNNMAPITPPKLRISTSSPPPPSLQPLEVPETPSETLNSAAGLEPPRTPTLKPAASPLEAPRIISPLSGITPSMTIPDSTPPPKLNLPNPPPPSQPSSSVSATATTSGTTQSSPPPTKRPKSPPPSALAPSDLVWTEAEITGMDPDDPLDDGYGINGIGFRPTPAMAQARSMRRKQQVADWRSREAREARSRRAERRRGVGVGVGGMGSGAEQGARRVRFVEG